MKIHNLHTQPIVIVQDGKTFFLPVNGSIDCSPVQVQQTLFSDLNRIQYSQIVWTGDNDYIVTQSFFNDFCSGFSVGLAFIAFAFIIRLSRFMKPSGGANTDL